MDRERFSRNTFNKLKHYVGVRLQQGVPIVDADWNEMEDIRKCELEAFLRAYIGDGVPRGIDSFLISDPENPGDDPCDFTINGTDRLGEDAGRCLVQGWDVLIEENIKYSEQPLYNDPTLADAWKVQPLEPLSNPGDQPRVDLVYLDVWEREVYSNDPFDKLFDPPMVNPDLGEETCIRMRREWVVRVGPPGLVPLGHHRYNLAKVHWNDGGAPGNHRMEDLRREIIPLEELTQELVDLPQEIDAARGEKDNLGARLDESLTPAGQLKPLTVDTGMIAAGVVTPEKIASDAVTIEKIRFALVEKGIVRDLPRGRYKDVRIEKRIPFKAEARFYMPRIRLIGIEGRGAASVTTEFVYVTDVEMKNTYHVDLRISNRARGRARVDVEYAVYVFAPKE